MAGPADWLRGAIAGEVRRFFGGSTGAVVELASEGEGLFSRRSVIWQVHGDMTAMMAGGVAALMVQMLHPAALAGIWDFSNFRADLHGRLRRTAAFIAVTTYGRRAQAEAAIERVRRIHARVEGRLPDGTPYRAADPRLLRFVHIAEADAFLRAWMRYREPWMSRPRQDQYLAELARVSAALGACDLPVTRPALVAALRAVRAELRADARTREVARHLLDQKPVNPAMAPFQRLTLAAGIDLLPDWVRRMHGLRHPALAVPALRAGAAGMGAVLRWAMAAPPPAARPPQGGPAATRPAAGRV
jgi:uncharacterized protein (DUF2236 family)